MSTNRIIVDASILKVHGEAEALRVANDTQYGLSSAVFTRDKERDLTFALDLHAGMTHIDDSSVDDIVTGPLGGEKNSGIGRFGDEWIIHEFTLEHWVTVRHSRTTYPF
jgi:aldehyde dehydrogenase (NAD+)